MSSRPQTAWIIAAAGLALLACSGCLSPSGERAPTLALTAEPVVAPARIAPASPLPASAVLPHEKLPAAAARQRNQAIIVGSSSIKGRLGRVIAGDLER